MVIMAEIALSPITELLIPNGHQLSPNGHQLSPIMESLTPNGHQLSPNCSHSSPRSELFKNNDKNLKELRRRRSETVVELRKQRKDDNIEKRRHIYDEFSFEIWSEDTEQENMLTLEEMISFFNSCNNYEIPVKYIRESRRLIANEIEKRQTFGLDIINKLFANGVIEKLINCLVSEQCCLSLLIEVVTLVAQLASVGMDQSSALVKLGVVRHLIPLLSYDNFAVVEQSVIALAHISSCSIEMRDLVMNTDFLRLILGLIVSETTVSPSKSREVDDRIHMVRAMSWSLYVMVQYRDIHSYKVADALMPYFVKLLNYDDRDVKAHILRALSITTERDVLVAETQSSPVLRIVQLVTSNISLLATIIDNLSPNNNDVVLYAIRVIGNIVSWGESYAQIVIQAGALHKFNHLINHRNSNIQKEVTFTVSNITAGNIAQIQAVIDANLVPSIVELLYFGDYKTQMEATHVMLNISAIGSTNQSSYLINIYDTIPNMNVFDAMATMLTSTDAKTIETALQVYNNLLVFAKKANVIIIAVNKCESSAAVYHIDSLQHHNNSSIAILATHIIDKYFTQDLPTDDLILSSKIEIDSDVDKQMKLNFSF